MGTAQVSRRDSGGCLRRVDGAGRLQTVQHDAGIAQPEPNINARVRRLSTLGAGAAAPAMHQTDPESLMLASSTRRVHINTTFSLEVAARTMVFLRLRPCEPTATQSTLVVRNPTNSQTPFDVAAERFDGAVQWHDRIALDAGQSTVSFSCIVDVPTIADERPSHLAAPNSQLMTPADWLSIQPSRYCRPDELGNEAWNNFGSDVSINAPATGEVVQRICDFVSASMTFEYGSTGPMTTATEAWNQKRGVCRDFAHIAISFCRALNIPTRYVFGYIPDIDVPVNDAPQDFCAWFEVLLGGRWWAYDARVNERRIGRIVVGRGRDAADVPMVSSLGAAQIDEFTVGVVESSRAFQVDRA